MNAKYHLKCYSKFIIHGERSHSSSLPRGRPLDENVSQGMEKIIDYIENGSDCQYTISELKELLGNKGLFYFI